LLIRGHLTLRFLQFGGSGERLRDRFPFHFASEAEIRAMRGLVGLMAAAVRFPAVAIRGRDRPTTEVGKFHHALKNSAPLLFQIGEGFWHRIPP
jgi:hypothetical protein